MHSNTRLNFFIVLAAALILIAPTEDKLLINFQGKLTGGEASLTGTISILLKIYHVEQNGIDIWSESYPDVPIRNGSFSVLMGSQASFPDDFFIADSEYYVGVVIENGAELSPRHRLTSVPFAANATVAQRADSAEFAVNASFAEAASSLSGPEGSPNEVVHVDFEGKVGIGTTAPSQKLEIAGHIESVPIAARWYADSLNNGTEGTVNYQWWADSVLFNTAPNYLTVVSGDTPNDRIQFGISGIYLVNINALQSQVQHQERGDVWVFLEREGSSPTVIGRSLGNGITDSEDHFCKHDYSFIHQFEAGDKIYVSSIGEEVRLYAKRDAYSSISILRLGVSSIEL